MPRRKLLKAKINEPSNALLNALWAMGHGCIAGIIILFLVSWLLLDHPAWQYAQLIGIHMMSGHVGNMTLGIEYQFPGWVLITQSCLQDLAQMFYIYPFYVKYGYRQLLRWKVIGPWVKQAHEAAMSHHKSVAPYGAVGLFLFVVIPTPSTGPVIGTLLGYTLGIGTGISFISCGSAVIVMGIGWYFGVDYASAFNEQVVPIMLYGIMIFFLGGMLLAGIRFLFAVRRRGTKVFDAEIDTESEDDASDDGDDDDDAPQGQDLPEKREAS